MFLLQRPGLATWLLCSILWLCTRPAGAQRTQAWTRFAVKRRGEEYYGYQNPQGQVKLPAVFSGFTNAQRFYHLMAVSEAASGAQYYVLKNGRKIGRDSVYVHDFQFDCESEGKIRYRDQRNRVGFFDAQGRAVIPALYNYVTPFHNGLAVALIGARRTCGSSPDTVHCEHPGWAGGRQVLLNARNEVLVNNLATEPTGSGHLNWYSLKINDPTPDTATTVTLRAANGDRYTFTDYEKEFTAWLYRVFVPAVRTGEAAAVQALCFSDIAVAARPFRGWPHFTPAAYLAKYRQSVLRPRLGSLRQGTPGVAIGPGALNTLLFGGRTVAPFLTACGDHFSEKYPVFELILPYPAQPATAPLDHQEHFEFIRTAAGYRLLSVSL
jgi:hypothetical protein